MRTVITTCLGLLAASQINAAELISINGAGNDAGNASASVSRESVNTISEDGRYVLFTSGSSDLGPTDTNGNPDLYLRDRQAGTTELISINAAGTDSGNGNTFAGTMSDDGRYVVFTSSSDDLVANDTNGNNDLFIRDRQSGTTTMISRNLSATNGGDDDAQNFSITPDAAFIVYTTLASDMVANDTNVGNDIFLYDRVAGTNTLISRNASGDAGNDGSDISGHQCISDDGRYIVFTSDASDIISGDTNGFADAFLYDTTTSTYTRISTVAGDDTTGGNGETGNPVISGDGSRIVMWTLASDLVTSVPDTNMDSDYISYLVATGEKALVTPNASGTAAASGGSNRSGPRLSDDGRYFAWESSMQDLTSDTNVGTDNDIYLRDLVNGVTTLVSINASGTASCNAQNDDVQLSANGRFVTYESSCTDLTTDSDINAAKDTFMYDSQDGINYLLSVSTAGGSTGDAFSYDPLISPSGQFIVFDSGASDLDATVSDTNANGDVYLVDAADFVAASAFALSSGGGGGSSSLGPLFVLLFAAPLVLSRRRTQLGAQAQK